MDKQTSTPDAPDRSDGTPSWWGEGSAAAPSSGQGDESTSSSAHTRISDATHQSEEAFAPPAYWVTPEPSSTRRSASQLPHYAGATRRVGRSPRRSNRTRRILLGANAAVILVIAALGVLLLTTQGHMHAPKRLVVPASNARKPVVQISASPVDCLDVGDSSTSTQIVGDGFHVLSGNLSCGFVRVLHDGVLKEAKRQKRAVTFVVTGLRSMVTQTTYAATCVRRPGTKLMCSELSPLVRGTGPDHIWAIEVSEPRDG